MSPNTNQNMTMGVPGAPGTLNTPGAPGAPSPQGQGISIRIIATAAVSFAIGMLALLFLGGWMQYNFGMLGMIGTELMILAIALLSILASRMKLSQVLRIRKSSGLKWLGALTIYLGAFCGSLAASLLLFQFFPEMSETGDALGGFITSGGFILALIGVVILPGICEEAWHRGYLLSSLGTVRSIALRVAIMGIVFGIFHFDRARFLQTMILGFGLSYMRIKTDNMLLPVAMHCLNNLISVSMTFLMLSMPQAATEQSAQLATPLWMTALMALFFVALALLFLALGRYIFFVDERRGASRLQPLAPPQQGSGLAWAVPQPPATGVTSWAPPTQQPLPQGISTVDTERRTRAIRTVTVVCICGGLALVSCLSCFVLTSVTGLGA